MRPLGDLIPHDEALQRILAACRPVADVEMLPLVEARDRVLAEPLVAPHDVPGFDRAAMDGFALRLPSSSDAGGRRWRVVGRVHAGTAFSGSLGLDEAVEIATGAPVPAGADVVVPVEWSRAEGGHVRFERLPNPGQHISRASSDLAKGQELLHPGTVLTPARLAVAAAAGFERVAVLRRPRVAVMSTGSELRPLGVQLRPGEIHDSNGPALTALFLSEGAEVERVGIDSDEVGSLAPELERRARACDLIVLSGGSSAGEKDLVRDAVANVGAIDFHGVRVKPGKPLLLGRVRNTPLIGLPGYPVSCLSDAYLFVLPALRRIAGRPPAARRTVRGRMAERVEAVRDRLWFLPVRLDGTRVLPTYRESGSTTSLSDAVGYVAVAPGSDGLHPGDEVDVVLF